MLGNKVCKFLRSTAAQVTTIWPIDPYSVVFVTDELDGAFHELGALEHIAPRAARLPEGETAVGREEGGNVEELVEKEERLHIVQCGDFALVFHTLR